MCSNSYSNLNVVSIVELNWRLYEKGNLNRKFSKYSPQMVSAPLTYIEGCLVKAAGRCGSVTEILIINWIINYIHP